MTLFQAEEVVEERLLKLIDKPLGSTPALIGFHILSLTVMLNDGFVVNNSNRSDIFFLSVFICLPSIQQ